jgi:TetR/AcrR family transcriptional repressor of mexJK operon
MPREIQSSKHPAVEPAPLKSHVKAGSKTNAGEAAKILQLIEAAEDIFLAKGYHTATMNDVAKAAGMSKKTVYQLIESKADLFAMLLDHHQEQIVIPDNPKDWPLHEVLVQYLLCLAHFLLSPKQISIIRLIMAEYTHGKDFGRIFHQKRVTKANLFLENCLIDVVPAAYKAVSDSKEMAAMLFGMALGEFHIGVLIGFRAMPTKAALVNRIRLAVDVFLKGCAAAEAPSISEIPKVRKPRLKKA